MNTRKFIGTFIFTACICFIPNKGVAQSFHARNVHFRTIDEKIEIFYDLPVNMDSIEVKIVFRKKSTPQFRYTPRFLRGDIGKGVFSGTNKKIVWNIKKEPPSVFTGSDFYFVLQVKRIPVIQKVVKTDSLKPGFQQF